MVNWRSTATRVRNSFSSRHDSNRYSDLVNPIIPTQHHAQHQQHQQQQQQNQQNQSQQYPQIPPPPSSSHSSQPQRHSEALDPHSEQLIQSYTTQPSTAQSSQSHIPTASVPSLDATSTGSSVSRVPGAFYIPNSIAQRASVNMTPADGAALRRQLAFDALALVRELPCFAEGWMLVKRDSSKISALFRTQWMPFWGELRGGMLLFCDPSSDFVQDQKRQIKLVFTSTNCIIDLKNTSAYSQIKLRRADGQSLALRVPNPQEAQQWCVALQTHTFQYTTIRLADFDWITAIGKGASGKVFLVRDNRTNARLALKVIDKSRVFRTHLTFQHVINERLVLEMCSGCPFVIQLRYAFQTDSHLYFATDFYDGGDVFSLLQSNRGRLSENHARRIIAEIVLALGWLHEQNIVYRDLKPENVVLDGDGHVRLADFGLAKLLKYEYDYLTQTICGTTAYAAPEMLQSKPYNVSLDLWCLGVFIYHILSGKTPFNFKGRTMEEMEEMQRTRQVKFSSALSLEAVSLIKGLLQIDPLQRSTLEDVKRHPFFRGVDWVRVAQKEPHPDDLSRFVGNKEQRASAVARLATARAQQLGAESDSANALARSDVQEISSMTLDRYLLRNINPEEWRHVSFSDDDDMSATAEFPAFVHKKGTEMETWAIAGWAWTCSEASGHAAKIRDGREGLPERTGVDARLTAAGRRSLPVWNEGQPDAATLVRAGVSDPSRQVMAQRTSLQENPTNSLQYSSNSERLSRPITDAAAYRVEPNNADYGGRRSTEYRASIAPSRHSTEANQLPLPAPSGLRRPSAKGVLNFGRITSSVRDARSRASVDNAGRSRKSIERYSKDDHSGRRTETHQSSIPRPSEKRHVKSSMEGMRPRVKS